jgi:hypothetical protein
VLRSHIGKEVAIIAPSLANFNAATAVVFEILRSRIAAPLMHGNPNIIFQRFVSASGVTVNKTKILRLIQVPARSCMAATKMAAVYDRALSAVANTEPKYSPPLSLSAAVSFFDGLVDCDQLTKALASDIFEFGQGDLPQGC